VLWITAIFFEAFSFILTIGQKGITNNLEGFPTDDGTMVFLAFIFLIAMVMAVLSLSLKDKANRWANMIIGAIYAIITIGHMLAVWTLPSYNPSYHTLPLWGASFIFKVLIVWFAYKWPK
jgi:heme A synthase